MYIRRFSLFVLFTAAVLTASGSALADKYRLGKEIQLTPGGSSGTADNDRPAVAYNWNQKEYLVVDHWKLLSSGETNICACRVSPNGSKTYLGNVSTGNLCKYPDVAYDPYNGKYLIVWSQYNSSASRWEIYGRIIPWDILDTNTPFLIASWNDLNLQIPAVAFGYNPLTGIYKYMVVWQTSSVGTEALQGIGRRPVSVDGTPLGSVSYIDPGPNHDFPDITFNVATTEYLVVWEAPGDSSGSGIDIFGRRLDLDGVNQGIAISINSSVNDDKRPAVTTNTQHRYLVVWQYDYWGAGTDWDIKGQFLDVNGNKVGGVQSIAETVVNETSPAVAASGGIEEYLTVWQKETASEKGIWGRLLYTDLSMLPSFEIAPPAGGDNENPAAGCHNSGYFVTYSRDIFDLNIHADIYGRMLLERAINPGLWLLLLDD